MIDKNYYAILTESLKRNPEYAENWILRGDAEFLDGRVEDAEVSYNRGHKAARLAEAMARSKIGHMTMLQLDHNAGLREIHETMRTIDDPKIESSYCYLSNFDPHISTEELYRRHADYAKYWFHTGENIPKFPITNPEKYNIAFMSADMHMHASSFFLAPLLRGIDRDKFHVTIYSLGERADGVTQSLARLCDKFIPCGGFTDAELYDTLIDGYIDILVDMTGHTTGSRHAVLVKKPAKVIVNWMAYPNTYGFKEVDYIITDEAVDGKRDIPYAETPIYLPYAFAFEPWPLSPDVMPFPYEKNGFITFCSFNNHLKLNDAVLYTWGEIMKSTPGSRLKLKSSGITSNVVREVILKKLGVSTDRVDFYEQQTNLVEHLSMYNDCDIYLDPWPFTGMTTTCEASWMGMPIVAMRTDRRCGRCTYSLLMSIHRDRYPVAVDVDQYISFAKDMSSAVVSNEIYSKKTVRSYMATSGLCDARVFAGHFTSNIVDKAIKDGKLGHALWAK